MQVLPISHGTRSVAEGQCNVAAEVDGRIPVLNPKWFSLLGGSSLGVHATPLSPSVS